MREGVKWYNRGLRRQELALGTRRMRSAISCRILYLGVVVLAYDNPRLYASNTVFNTNHLLKYI